MSGRLRLLLRRLGRWVRHGVNLESGPGPLLSEPAPASAAAAATRDAEQSRRRLDACNQALAAAINARDQLRETAAAVLRARDECQAELRRLTETGHEESGAAAALRLQELLAEEHDLQEQLQAAQTRVDDLNRLREQLLGRLRPDI
ncbi:MAG TPA: hypothetical protein VNU68_15850 [Verrucomicrobiae bacterium]|nr:hypothetical protein [Verrucomicrobiae bacterium]